MTVAAVSILCAECTGVVLPKCTEVFVICKKIGIPMFDENLTVIVVATFLQVVISLH